jgi:hypothetical protein
MIQIILGEYHKNKVKLIILSDKDYLNVKLYSNGKIILKIDIHSYAVNILELDNIESNNYYYFELEYLDKILDTFKINLKSNPNPFDNVLVVNCDSAYGYETGTWDSIEESNESRYVFHLGDQIYNDMIFQKHYNILKNKKVENINPDDKKKILIDCYNYFLEQFTRNNKTNILKNNFNIMIPDDHEVVDNSFVNRIKKDRLEIYWIIYEVINNLSNKIELGLRYGSNDLNYIEDPINSSLYIVNYSLDFSNDFFSKYDLENKIAQYKNIIFLQRKICNSIKNKIITQMIYLSDKFEMLDIDWILNICKDKDNAGKNFYILCGDDHIKTTTSYYSNKQEILTVKGVGPINSVVDLLNYSTILNTKIKGIEMKSEKILENGYVKIFYKNDKINVKDVINKKSYFFHIKNSILSGAKFVSFKFKK